MIAEAYLTQSIKKPDVRIRFFYVGILKVLTLMMIRLRADVNDFF